MWRPKAFGDSAFQMVVSLFHTGYPFRSGGFGLDGYSDWPCLYMAVLIGCAIENG